MAERKIISIVGEVAGIRPFDPKNSTDIYRLHAIFGALPAEFSPQLRGLTQPQVLTRIEETQPGLAGAESNTYYFAVVGMDRGMLPAEEVNQTQGWICFKPDTYAQELYKRRVLPQFNRALEIVYARFPESPVSHHMASGVRQACALVGRMYSQFGPIQDLLITAYVLPHNKGSQQVLKAAGFEDRGKSGLMMGEKCFGAYSLDWRRLTDTLQRRAGQELFPTTPRS